MTERAMLECVTEYLVNSLWQIPLFAAGAWLLVKVVRPHVLVQHWLWLSVLAMAVVLPLHGLEEVPAVRGGITIVPNATPSMAIQVRSFAVRPPSLEHAALKNGNDKGGRAEVPLPVRGRRLVLSLAATRWLMGMYAVSVLLGGLRLGRGLLATRRLVRCSRAFELDQRTIVALEEACRRLGVARPQVRESSETDGPVIVRSLRPVMVLPLDFGGHAEEEVRAALLHELAHVRRQDYLVNLLCQIAALPIVWHPAVHGIQQRIRRTREMLCDAIAADEMSSAAEYARCLVSLAQQILRDASAVSGTQAVGLFEENTMEERVMKLTETKVVMSGRARLLRGSCGLAVVAIVIGAALSFHVRPTFAAAVGVTAQAKTGVGQNPAPVSTAGVPVSAGQAKPSETASAPILNGAGQTGDNSGSLSLPKQGEEWPTATAGKGSYVHRWVGADGTRYVIANHDPKQPTAEEQLREERKLSDSKLRLDERDVQVDATKLNLQMEEMQKELAKIDVNKMLDEVNRSLDDSKMTLKMKKLDDKLNDPVFQRQFSELDRKLNDPAFQKQLADLEKNAALNAMNDPKLKRELADIEKNAGALSAEAQRQAEKAMTYNVQMQKEMESGELKQKLDEATRLLEEVRKEMQAK